MRNLSMLADYYEFTMSNGFIETGREEEIAYFEMFFRRVPDKGGFAIAAGLEQVVEYLKSFSFTDEDIEYLKNKKIFGEKFLEKLKNFKFTCDVWAIEEGTPIFPHEPLIIIKGPLYQAQIIETMILLSVNHQTLIATKANRIVRFAEGRDVSEFGSRRAQGADAAIFGARAAYIGGVNSTSNTLAAATLNIPTMGTMAHSWVQSFDSEIEAFRQYAKIYPTKTVLLVDTYNTLKEGVPNAIKVFDEILKPQGHRPIGIRIDSGDMTYLSKEARKMLDDAGYEDCKIIVSNSLDEYIIKDLIHQGAKIDSFGVGERLITARSEPVFGGVYKLVAIEKNGEIEPKIKISENVEKITTPGFKQIWRLYDKKNGKALADVLTHHDEEIDESKPLEIFHPIYTWKRTTLENFEKKPLLVQIFKNGELIYKLPNIEEIKTKVKTEIDSLWDEIKRLESPHKYYVDLSEKLWKTRETLLKKGK